MVGLIAPRPPTLATFFPVPLDFYFTPYIYRKSIWLGGNRYSAILNRLTGEDYDFLVKLHTKGHRLYYVDEPSCYYRQHGISRNNHNF